MTRTRARANGEGSIFPYRNGFAAYAWVTTPTGRRQRKYVYGRTRAAVHEKWIKLQKEARERPIMTKSPTLAEYLDYWLHEVVTPNLAPLTASTYETLVRLYITPGLGTKRLDRLNVRDVQQWLTIARDTCQCCAQDKDKRRPEPRCCAIGKCCRWTPSTRTIKDLRTVLRSALSHAIREELIVKNVASLVKVPTGRTRKLKAWTGDEARAFLESARSDDDPLYALYVLVLVLGLRKGEALGLQWSHVDLADSTVQIEYQLQRVKRQLLLRETKTATSDARLPLPKIAATALRLRQAQQERHKAAAAEAWQRTGLVFTSRYGTPIEPRNVNRAFNARCAAAGIRRITVHDARRTCGTLLADLDVHPRVAMQILRHADFTVTMEVYTQVSSKQTQDALRRLSESLDQ